LYFGNFDTVDALAEKAIQTMQAAGAVIVDPADIRISRYLVRPARVQCDVV